MKEILTDVQIFGGDDRIEALTTKVKGGDSLKFGDINVKVHFTPCHTTGSVLSISKFPGHVLYEVSDSNDKEAAPSLFTGDTLFIGGCGR